MGEAKKKNSSIDFRTLTMVLVLVLPVGGLYSDHRGNFLTTRNLSNLIRQAAFTGIMGVGMTLVIVTGGIDLSAGMTWDSSAVSWPYVRCGAVFPPRSPFSSVSSSVS